MINREKHNPIVEKQARRMAFRALALFMGIASILAGCQPHAPQADKRLLAT